MSNRSNCAHMHECAECGERKWVNFTDNRCDSCYRILTRGTAFERESLRRKKAAWETPDFSPRWLVGQPQLNATTCALLPCDADTIKRCEAWNPTLEKPILVLHGPSHVGKTRLAALVLNRLATELRTEPEVFWPGDIAGCVAAAWALGAEHYEELLKRSCVTPLLFLDDLDKSKVTDRTADFVLGVIKARVRQGFPTVITTNLIGDDLSAQYGPQYGPPLVNELRTYGTAVCPKKK